MDSIVNIHPWNDICSIIWIISALGVFDLGHRHFWVVTLNLGEGSFFQKIIQAKRPVEFDRKLQPLTDRGAMSFAFPSIESHMAVVIMGHFFYHLPTVYLLLWVPFTLAVVAMVGVSRFSLTTFQMTTFLMFILFLKRLLSAVDFHRLYTKSRFPHQIVGSWVTGIVGLMYAVHFIDSNKIHLMDKISHAQYVGFALLCIMTNFAITIESNDSRYVP